MAARYDLIVFDWDGTVMDSTSHIAQSLRLACMDLSYPPPSLDEAAWIIGMGLNPSLKKVLPDLPVERYPELTAAYRRHFLSGDDALPLFPGIADLIASLAAQGNLLAVATGKSRAGLERAFEQSGLRAYFDASCCADETFAKPDPAMLFSVMERTGAHRNRTLMIGDTSHDLQLARNAGVSAVGVSYGAHAHAALQDFEAEAIVSTPAELIAWLVAAGQLPEGLRSKQIVANPDGVAGS